MLLTLAVIGPAHALKGEVRLEIRTDDPEGRLAPGTTVPTEPSHAGPLTVSRLRFDGSRWFGLRALGVSGEELGEVTDLEPGVAQDRLVVTTPEGDEVAVPFVEALVPAIDPEAGTVTLAPPGGLFPGRGEAEEVR